MTFGSPQLPISIYLSQAKRDGALPVFGHGLTFSAPRAALRRALYFAKQLQRNRPTVYQRAPALGNSG